MAKRFSSCSVATGIMGSGAQSDVVFQPPSDAVAIVKPSGLLPADWSTGNCHTTDGSEDSKMDLI